MHVIAIGGSDASISAALRARELDPASEVTVVVGDAYPNFSICGIPYYVSGEVAHWRNLAHRTTADLEYRRISGRRPQGLLPRQPPHSHAVHRRSRHRAAPGRAALRPPARLDLSYTPPLGSPWEAVQLGAQAWQRQLSQY